LKYNIQPDDVIRLDGGQNLWTRPPLSEIKDPADPSKIALQLAVLHIYNHPFQIVDSDHNKREFDRTAAFLGTRVRLTIPVNTAAPNDPLPTGLLDAELSCLAMREQFVVRILNHLRTGAPLVGGGHGGCGSEVCGCPDGHNGL
jgi:hypothetical protein